MAEVCWITEIDAVILGKKLMLKILKERVDD